MMTTDPFYATEPEAGDSELELLGVLPRNQAVRIDRRFRALHREYRPRTPSELMLARRAALVSWRLEQADLQELALHTRNRRGNSEADPSQAGSDHDGELLNEFDSGAAAERLRRHQMALERSWLKILDKLAKMVRDRELRERAEQAKPEVKAGPAAPVVADRGPATGNAPTAPRISLPNLTPAKINALKTTPSTGLAGAIKGDVGSVGIEAVPAAPSSTAAAPAWSSSKNLPAPGSKRAQAIRKEQKRRRRQAEGMRRLEEFAARVESAQQAGAAAEGISLGVLLSA